MHMIQCCVTTGWTYLVLSSFVLFVPNLEWLVTRIPEGITIPLCSLLGVYASLIEILPSMLVFGQKARPWETFKILFKMVEWFPLNR
jgi:hypothetical protein